MAFQLASATIEHSDNPTKILLQFNDRSTGNTFQVWITPERPMADLTLRELHQLGLKEAAGQASNAIGND